MEESVTNSWNSVKPASTWINFLVDKDLIKRSNKTKQKKIEIWLHHIIIICSLHQRYCNIVWVSPEVKGDLYLPGARVGVPLGAFPLCIIRPGKNVQWSTTLSKCPLSLWTEYHTYDHVLCFGWSKLLVII